MASGFAPGCWRLVAVWLLALSGISRVAASDYPEPYKFTTLAGNPGYGWTDATGALARFHGPADVAVDAAGNAFVVETDNCTVRKITPGGVVTTIAGRGGSEGATDGPGGIARFRHPRGIAVDRKGNLYVADTGNHTIRKITPAGNVTTLAGSAGFQEATDGAARVARFASPEGVAVDRNGTVYIADTGNQLVRKISPSGNVSTLAGSLQAIGSTDGTGSVARFNRPGGVAVAPAGDIYVADTANFIIRKITKDGIVTTLAGRAGSHGSADGRGGQARFGSAVRRLTVDAVGNVYVADTANQTIRKITPAGSVSTVAGATGRQGWSDGSGSGARFKNPEGVAVDGSGRLVVADTGNHTIRLISKRAVVTTLAGTAGPSLDGARNGSTDGTGFAARFRGPWGLALDPAGDLIVADGDNHTVRKVTPQGVVTTLAGKTGVSGSTDGTGAAARFHSPAGVAVDRQGTIYVSDRNNHTIRKITPAGVVTTLVGAVGQGGVVDGAGPAARFSEPGGLATDATGNLYVADAGGDCVRKVTPAGDVTTLAGLGSLGAGDGFVDGQGAAARFSRPSDLTLDAKGNLYVADTYNNAVRKITPDGAVTTLVGFSGESGSADGAAKAAQFSHPQGIAIDRNGALYVSDTENETIRRISPEGVVTTLAGRTGDFSSSADGIGEDARFYEPRGIAVDAKGRVYVADRMNSTIRLGQLAPPVLESAASTACNRGGSLVYRVTFSGSPTSVSASGLPAGVTFDPANRTLSGRPTVAGTYAIKLSARNSVGTGTAFLMLMVNAAPTFDAIPDQLMLEDAPPPDIPFVVKDAETPGRALALSLSTSNSRLFDPTQLGMTAPDDNGRGVIRLVPRLNQTGIAKITLKASDGMTTASTSFTVTVKAVNDAPAIVSPGPQAVPTDGSLTVAFTVSDVDTPVDRLTVTVQSSNLALLPLSAMLVSGAGRDRAVKLTPLAHQMGSANITLTASDGRLSQSITFPVDVEAAPAIRRIPAQTIQEDTAPAAIPVVISDADTPASMLRLTVVSSDPTLLPAVNIKLGGSGANRTVALRPAANRSGRTRVTLTVSDGRLSSSTSFILTVNAVNDAPTLKVPPRVALKPGGTATMSVVVGDVETAASRLQVTAHSDDAALSSNQALVLGGSGTKRTLRVTAPPDKTGTTVVTVTASDGQAATRSSITVFIDSPPTIAPVADTTIKEDATGSVSIKLGDAESAAGELTLSAKSSNPALLSVSAFTFAGGGANRTLTFKPAPNKSGTATVTLTVSDGDFSSSTTFRVTVQPVDDPPSIGAVDRQVMTAGWPLHVRFTVSDIDTAVSSVTVTAKTTPTLLTEMSGDLNGAWRCDIFSPEDCIGPVNVTLTASDGQAKSSRSFLVDVVYRPTISEIPNQTVAKNTSTAALKFTVGDLDMPASQLKVTATSLDPALLPYTGVVLGGTGANRTVTVRPATNKTGTGSVRIEVDDGRFLVWTEFQVEVTATATKTSANATTARPVFIREPVARIVKAGQAATFSVEATAPASLHYQWFREDVEVPGATGATLTMPAARLTDAGGYAVTATNAAGSTTSAPAELTVVEAKTVATRSGPIVAVTQTLAIAGAADGMRLSVPLSSGWRYLSGATGGATTHPASGDVSLLEWTWKTSPVEPVAFTYVLDAPANQAVPESLDALLEVRSDGARTKLLINQATDAEQASSPR